MSHLKERKDKNCLNCNAHVHGKYCHICGQENIEPAESAWHLVTHFFNDITHFDGKFFSTLKLLITKPGFLPAEYKRGRRVSYLNPVRMYIFTSFIFFLILFSITSPRNEGFFTTSVSGLTQKEIANMDSSEFATFTKTLSRQKVPLTREQFKVYVDSLERVENYSITGDNFESEAAYDSLIRTGKVKQNWIQKKLTRKNFELRKKYPTQREAMQAFLDKLFHTFPQILFISLPFFALWLSLLYIRRKDYYFVSHGIFSIHLYIFYFIVLLLLLLTNTLEDVTGWLVFDWIDFFLMLATMWYEYKAMRYFYAQRRAKTIFKFFAAFFGRLLIIILLFAVFFFLSIYNL